MATRVRRDRAFWEKTVRDFQSSHETHAAFARSRGVPLAAFQYWLYKLRGESREPTAAAAPVRIVPVTMTGTRTPEFVESGVDGVVVRFHTGTEASYVAQLVAAIQRRA